MATTVVFGGGPTPTERIRSALEGVSVDFVIAADSGLESCLESGLRCDLVVGDMDSVSPAVLDRAHRSGSAVERHDVDKDATDLELALERAAARVCDGHPPADPSEHEVLVIGSAAGRLDHLVASVALVCSPRFESVHLRAVLGDTTVFPVHSSREVVAQVGSTVTLLALHGPVEGLTVSGMRWPLRGASLEPGSTLGVSNVISNPLAEIKVSSGPVSVLIPANEPDPPNEPDEENTP